MAGTMELVRFTIAAGREEEFVARREAAIEALRTMPGLLSATLARAEDGTWVDVVLWRTRDEALAADRAFRAGELPPAAMEWASVITQVLSTTHAEVGHHSPAAGDR